jgi:DNA-binding SARP family transcriptional activator/pimeloyl-ACP methyl ester carboxylesterase
VPLDVPALRVLGPVEVAGPGGELLSLGDRQRLLLGVLVAHRGTVVPADALMEAAWGGDSDRSSALHTQISRLRRALEAGGVPATVETRPGGYMLDADPSDVDADRFEEACGRAQRGADPAEAAAVLGEALALWRGPAYADLADLDRIQPEAVRLDERRLAATESRGTALVDAGRPEQAIAELEPFVRNHPLREGAMGSLMRALYACHRQSDALRHYREHRERLAEELGLEPAVALQRLELDILHHDVDVAVDVAGPGRRPERTRPAPLDELALGYLQRSDGRAIAHATLGDGPAVVSVPAWVTSLEVIAAGRDPRSSLLERLAQEVRLTMYDRLGTGLSEGPVEDFSLEAAVDELVSVLEHTGPAALLAVSQAGPAAITVAAERPDLVTHLILFGTFADASAAFPDLRTADASLALLKANWGLGSRLLAGLYRPGASEAVTDHLARVMRESAPPEVAAGYLEEMYRTDVSDRLARVAAPALVVHYTGDRVIPFSGGRHLAAGLPGCTFVPLTGRYHLPDVDDLDRIVRDVVEFVRR